MAGFISNPHVASPKDAWSLWRNAITLANAGSFKLADSLVWDVLDYPTVPDDLRKLATDRQRQGWARGRQSHVLDRDGPIPF